MSMHPRTRTTTTACITLLGALVAGCASQSPQPGTATPAWTPAPVGSSWLSAQRNTGSYGTDQQMAVTRLPNMDWNGSPALALKLPTGTLLQQPADGRWLALLSPDGKPVAAFDPPAGWTQPITVGQQWTRQQTVRNPVSGRSTSYESRCTVAAFEKVTVPAGSFDAFRVECSTSQDVRETYWTAPTVHPFIKAKSVRGPGHPSGPGTQDVELLRAPS
jgi:hypothetical protein